ncbi:unnamed protein product [Macrosiphum euphorbiae]|uniref:Uncharacterized protein n=1 Tax=Macrosiphum euphorbiae TaxID=13131 RepID=A0AAV0Y9K9_9HEMI|nr:unnamed protein product [Macrosiphum euphorbiae]
MNTRRGFFITTTTTTFTTTPKAPADQIKGADSIYKADRSTARSDVPGPSKSKSLHATSHYTPPHHYYHEIIIKLF